MTVIKTLFTIVFLSISIITSSSTFFVSTSGSDNNPGTKDRPFKTLNKAWSAISPGDTIFLRAGKYNNSIMPATTNFKNKNGTASDPIVISNYQNEKPILDYSDAVFTTQKAGIWIENVKYLHIKGIRITNIKQPIVGNIAQYGIILWKNVSNCIFEQIETDHIGGWGVTIGDYCSNNLFLNCDSHHNADPHSTIPYDWGDGFQSGSPTSTNNTFRGCRAWGNSDDGWDLRLYDGSVILESCWSFRNGYKPNTWEHGGNGEGFKLGMKRLPSTNTVLRTVVNCLAFDNYSIGFNASAITGYGTFRSTLYNNTAFRNGVQGNYPGFNFQQPDVENILKNNLSYKNGRDYIYPCNVNTNNSWNMGPVSESDFQTIDTTGVSGIRKENGDLPVLPFLRLAQNSGLIDAGINVGYPYSGKAPDIGTFETAPPAPVAANQPPVVSISSPTKSASFTSPASITITAPASDPDGSITKVEFYQGTVKIGEKATSPYSYSWNSVPEGTYSLTVVATDNANSKTVSAAVSITVVKPATPANKLPIVSISSPAQSSSFTSPATVTINAAASDPDGSITKVEFYQGTVKIGEKATSPYSFTWNEVPDGTYSLTAVATDNANSKTVSAAVSVTVVKPATPINKSPIVSILSPTKGNSFTSPATVTIDVNASDPDGSITKVELFNGAVKLYEKTAAPYSFTLKDLPAGSYELKAVATDNLKAVATSTYLAITVTPIYEARDYFNLYPNPNNGRFSIDFTSLLDADVFTLTVVDLIGNTVYREELSTEQSTRQFDLSHLNSGIYVLMIAADQILLTQKFIKG